MGLLNKKTEKTSKKQNDIYTDFENFPKSKVTSGTDSDVSVNAEDSRAINSILSDKFSEEMMTATFYDSPENRKTLSEILINDKEFKNLPTYGHKEIANRVVEEIVGLGIISDILKEHPDTTDIAYGGRFLTVETNNRKFIYTPKNSELALEVDHDYIEKIVSRFANREKKEFSEGNPLFNGFYNNIRISATHGSLSPTGVTMSLRISKPHLALTEDNFYNFAPDSIYILLGFAMKAHSNIIISGQTGTGKTELLKLLVKFIEFRDKVIMIEDVAETHLDTIYPDKDIWTWTTKGSDSRIKDGIGTISISDHVKNALRNNPRWLMVSETRGAEAYEMFQAVLSGHQLLTTLHAINNESVPSRFVGMSSLGDFKIDIDSLRDDFVRYMDLGIHIEKKVFSDNSLLRYVDEIAEFDPESGNKIHPIFQQTVLEEKDEDGNRKIVRHYQTYPLTDQMKEKFRTELGIGIDPKTREAELKKIWPYSDGQTLVDVLDL